LVLDGDRRAGVPDKVIADLKGRERGGLVELPVDWGSVAAIRCASSAGLVEGLRPQQRIEILLAVLGRVELAKRDIAASS
jgi:hypothetical protein